MIKPILQLGNDTLRRKSLPVKRFYTKELDRLIEDLSDTLHDAQRKYGYGRGIAAPQIGELKRIIFIDTPELKEPLINPRITQASAKMFEVWDSCFSFNLAFFILVDRHYSIKVEYFTQEGKKQIISVENKLSELLQHEIDHLNGILATDRLKDPKKIIMRQEWEKTLKQS